MQRLLFLFLVLTFICALSMSAQAAPRWGVNSGTTIQNEVTINASNANPSDTNTGETTVVAVTASWTDSNTASPFSINVGETAVFEYTVKNQGNTSDSFFIELSALNYTDGVMQNWTRIIVDKNGVEQGTSFVIGPIAEEGEDTFIIRIVASSVPTESPNDESAFCTVTVGAAYSRTFTTEYLGDNDTTYASSNYTTVFYDTATISAAVFTVEQVCTGVTSINGDVTQGPIPGATLWYEIVYENTGSGTGVDVFLYVAIDTDNVAIDTNSVGDQNGWTFHYTTVANPTFQYDGTGGDWTAAVPALPHDVTYIKWDKATVAGSETNNLRYRVIIK